ncbi:fucose 4-O-acetylase-like acetyltransferase [Streptomyces sp. Amel2xB2]|uniref:acyltransferase family protein n=1 Tax=Streptomyces sp. Amel2xB2 TaxID=1305829 RepID=UPI000DBF621B|nr:acyltransferase family protein [Streptomyces sp. Amel2xB2]RAJ63361.1 fucose 4-O-acetylase-like acetyltransferase [Streptomyces sp. Amel2xB2]
MLQSGIERAPLPPQRDQAGSVPGLQDPEGAAGACGEQAGTADQRTRPARDPFLDNAKYLTIVLVAVGHVWAPLAEGSRSTSALYYLLYTFHMPAFILVSGYLSRGFECRPRQIKRLLTNLVVPYLVFQTLLTLFMRWAADDPDREFSYQEPEFALWFLVALCLWRVTTPLWKLVRWPLPVSVAVAVAASVTPTMSDDLGLMRVAQFLPFFVLGLQLRPEHFALVRHRAVRILAVPVTAGALVVSYASVPYISGAPFLHDKDAQSLGLPAWLGAVMTLTAFGCALVMTVCFLAWVPRRQMWCTSLGAGTLCAYVLHVFPVQYAKQAGWFEMAGARHPLDRFAITVLAAGMMTLLCTAPVRRIFRLVLEPGMGWFFTRRANATAEDEAPTASAPRLAPGASPADPLQLPPAPAQNRTEPALPQLTEQPEGEPTSDGAAPGDPAALSPASPERAAGTG